MWNHAKVLETTANGSFTWEQPVQPTPEYIPGQVPGNLTVTASVIGSGAVSATITAYRGAEFDGTARYDDTPAVTFTLSGTNISTDSQAFVPTGSVHWKFVVASLSGSTTASVVVDWYAE